MFLQEHLADRMVIEENLYKNPNYSDGPDDAIIHLDPSALKKSYCELAITLTAKEGLRPLAMNEFLLFGKTLHKFAEWYSRGIRTVPVIDRGNVPIEEYLVWEYTSKGGTDVGALIGAFGQRPFAPIPAPIEPAEDFTEINVKIPFVRITDKQTGKRVVFKLCARMDHLYMDQWGTLIALDYKTTRAYDMQKTLAEYSHSIQFKVYYWLLNTYPEYIFPEHPALIDTCRTAKVACQVCPVHLNRGGGKWILGPVLRYPDMLAEINMYVMAHILSMAPVYLGMRRAFKNGLLSDSCGKCDYARLCAAGSLVDSDRIRNTEFKLEVYDPEMF